MTGRDANDAANDAPNDAASDTPNERPDRVPDAPTGLIVGRFIPPHLGHSFLIESAARRVDRLVVFVNTRAGEPVPGELRAAWLADLHPDVTVIEVRHDLDNDWADEELWAKWIALFRAHWPHPDGPHVVFSSETYGGELARRLGAEPVVVDHERVAVPVSGTMVRTDPRGQLHRLAPVVRAWVERWADERDGAAPASDEPGDRPPA